MARDPRGVPDVVFKPTKYMNFVGAIGKRKELEANRKMEKAKKLASSLPEAELGKYRENWRPLAGQLYQDFTDYRNETIALASQGNISGQELAQRRKKLTTMKMEIAGYAEDMKANTEKYKEAKQDLEDLMKEVPSGNINTYLRSADKNDPLAQNIRSAKRAVDIYSGKPLATAKGGFDENGRIKFSAEGVNAETMPQYDNFIEQYSVEPVNFEDYIRNGGAMNFPELTLEDGDTKTKGQWENEMKRYFKTFALESNTPKQQMTYIKYAKEVKGFDGEEAQILWNKMREHYAETGELNEDAQEYYGRISEIGKNEVGFSRTEEDGSGLDIDIGSGAPGVPGVGFNTEAALKNNGLLIAKGTGGNEIAVYGDDAKTKIERVKTLGKPQTVDLYDRGVTFKEGKYKINVSEDQFLDDTGEKVEIVDASVNKIYKGKNGNYYASVKGIRKKGRDLPAKRLIKLTDDQKGSLLDAFGSKAKEMGFDTLFEAKVGKTEGGGTPSQKKQDKLNSDEKDALDFIKSQSDQEVIDAVLRDYPQLKDYI